MSDVVELISKPGFYADIAEDRYHNDPVIEPSLSSSVGKELVNRSARHAWMKHPRLNPKKAEEIEKTDRKKDIGSAAHKLILGKGRSIKVLNFDDYKKKDAQVAARAARDADMVPLLADDMRKVELIHEAFMDQILDTELRGYFELPGQSELTFVWREKNGVWCRGRFDRLPDECREAPFPILADVKTTTTSAQFTDWEFTAYDMAFDFQSVFYPRGLRALCPAVRDPYLTMKFAVIEQEEPFCLSINEFPGVAVGEAIEDMELAIQMWGACLQRGTDRKEWPGYGGQTNTMEKAPWRSTKAEVRRRALQDLMMHWQRPHEIDAATPAAALPHR